MHLISLTLIFRVFKRNCGIYQSVSLKDGATVLAYDPTPIPFPSYVSTNSRGK